MNFPIILFKKKQLYLTIFLPTLLIGYVTTGSANAADSNALTQMDSSTPNQIVNVTTDSAIVSTPAEIVSAVVHKSIRIPRQQLGIPIPTSELPVRSLTDSDQFAPTNWVIMDPPVKTRTVMFYDERTQKEVIKPWSALTNQQILRLLSNTTTQISVSKIDVHGKADYVVATATGEIGTYRVIMDFTSFMVEDAIGTVFPIKIGDAKVGVGLRLTADVTTNTANIDLGSLMALGIAANSKKLQGTMRVDSIGIRLENDSGIMLSNTKIDETGVLKTLETLAIVQSKIANEGTYLEPHVLSVKPIPYKYIPLEVAKDIEKEPVTENQKPCKFKCNLKKINPFDKEK